MFPLIISAIEVYQQGLEILRLWDVRNYQAKIEELEKEIEI